MNTPNNSSTQRYLPGTAGKALALALALTASVFGARAQDRAITLDEAIKLGLETSKTLKLSQTKIDQAVSQFAQAKDKALPTGNVSLAYNRAQIPANTLDLGAGDPIRLPSAANAFLGIASVNETIFAGRRLRYAQESTDLLVKAAKLDADKDKEEIAYNVISEYYNLYKVMQSKKVVDQNLKTIDAQIKQSQRFFEQGLVTKNDVLRFQLQRANVELNGIDLENNRKIVNYNLDILLGLPEGTQLSIAQNMTPDKNVGPMSTYLDSAYTNRKELRVMDIRTQSAETNIKSINAEKSPTLSASLGAYYVNASANPLPRSGQFITPITAGLTAAWNFGTLWTTKNKVTEARIERDQTVINKGIVTDNIKNEVNRNYQTYQTALSKIKLLQTSIDQAGENNKILENKYQSNIASATDRADANTLLYQAQINLELAKADAGLAYYTLLKSTGSLTK
ncbi:TolC family protein [Mucilaginibacter myungsuensis]|uniref:TolC family protein n=1 Tax=Mucilaginibacter myungsuensis TaxID=649104 RepID=A0A929PUZ3_9SPHI|nr:TolC family protein [Mucilaginibacter myungsuensis]MBE9661278.1 TolC family protein [Mucilaginibacter myungsuensis]MDN3597421.1 TolC family protein [Mucilaginibacter myungsuensis]